MALQTSDFYREIVEKFVNKFTVAFGHLDLDKILIMEETEKKPKKYADVRKVTHPYSSLMEYKFIMTFYNKVIEGMTTEQINMLVYHELLHIDENFDKLVKHDLQDFKQIVAAYGVNWDTDKNLPDILDEDELPTTQDE